MVRYLDTPVGPYNEVFAALPVGPLAGTVPFMAVDSERSMAGGRGNWSLPKEMAVFERGHARGAGWDVAVRARIARLPAFPVGGAAFLKQNGRTARLDSRGRGRAALVTVETQGTPLRAGTFPAVVLGDATFTLGKPD